jgi:glycine dehydrogenase subunit 1
MSLLGPAGLSMVAAASLQRTADLVNALGRVPGVKPAFSAPRFHEAVLLLDRPVAPVLAALARRGIFGGLDLADRHPELGHALLVCATETKLEADIDSYAAALTDIMNSSRACRR